MKESAVTVFDSVTENRVYDLVPVSNVLRLSCDDNVSTLSGRLVEILPLQMPDQVYKFGSKEIAIAIVIR